MLSITPNLIIFYFGSILIIGIFLYVLILKFKEEDNIDLKEHSSFLIIYTILLILSIYTWGILYKIITFNIAKIKTQQIILKELKNG